jgi:NADH:ubiquinone oxidoreductase subunit 5 (subunit L)/multisubunit Na+/H+ antiporter MnhA subunit
MEGPTPVSSLLHAATMVTAGVYLILRFSFLFEQVQIISFLITFIGGLTVFMASFLSFFNFDLKKILAYSTMCQIGFMFVSCGLSCYVFAFFHLIIHAFYKCSLFLIAGVLIELHNGEQDIRRMNSHLYFQNPLVFIFFFISCLALLGFPASIGFFSKENILDSFSFFGLQIYIQLLLWLGTYLYLFFIFRCFYFFFFFNTSFVNINNKFSLILNGYTEDFKKLN